MTTPKNEMASPVGESTRLSFDDLFQITCGKCGKANPVTYWRELPLGHRTLGEFQCPNCGYAFRRQRNPNAREWYDKFVECVEIPSGGHDDQAQPRGEKD